MRRIHRPPVLIRRLLADPYFSQVVLSLHGDGANGSTTITDSSSYARALTALGSLQVSTASPRFGSGSLLFTASTFDNLLLPSSADFAFGTGDFTFDAWIKFTTVSGTAQVIYDGRNPADNTSGFLVALLSSQICLNSGPATRIATVSSPSTGNWYFLRVSSVGGVVSMALDGTSLGSWTNPYSYSYAQPRIGRAGDSAGAYLDARLDDLRITKGLGRSITEVPTAAFPDA